MIALALFLAAATPVSQARAVALAGQAMASIDPTTPLICLDIAPEKTTRAQFDLVVREVHDFKCGGDPAEDKVREHFRVTRAPVAISRREGSGTRYHACKVTKSAVTCPDPAR